MTSTFSLPADRRLPALAATLAVHLAFLLIWRLAQPLPEAEPRSESMQWLRLLPLPRAAPPRADAAETPPPKTERHGTAPRPGPRPRVDVEVAATPAAPSSPAVRSELDEMPAPAPVQGNGETLMERARREVGAVDRTLTKARHRNLISAPVVTAHMRMQKGMELAYDLAPPGLFEKAKITEIIDPGGYGRRRYRVVTHGGTFCMTYESNHAPDGIDTMKNGIKPKITNCDADEQPATEQKW
jgi:hypothetical protein